MTQSSGGGFHLLGAADVTLAMVELNSHHSAVLALRIDKTKVQFKIFSRFFFLGFEDINYGTETVLIIPISHISMPGPKRTGSYICDNI